MEKTNGLPHNLDAEKAVLGSIILDNSCLSIVLEMLKPEDFYSEAHRNVLESAVRLSESWYAIEYLTLADSLTQAGKLESSGGVSFVSSLTDGVPLGTEASVKEYCRIVKEYSTRRRAILISQGSMDKYYALREDPKAILDAEILSLSGLVTNGNGKHGFEPLGESLGNLDIDRAVFGRGNAGIPSGFDDLDNLTLGFQRGEMTIIAARPTIGKTGLGLNIAAHAASLGNKVGFFSVEMNRESLMVRLLCSATGLSSHRLRSGNATKNELLQIMQAFSGIGKLPLHIDDSSGLTVAEARAKAVNLRNKHGLDLLIVDYLQLMTGGKVFEFKGHREQEVAFVSRSLKAIAKELQIPVIALTQLNREPEKGGKSREPNLTDLRECVTRETKLVDASTGIWKSIADTKAGDSVLAMSGDQKIGVFEVEDVWSTGIKPVFRVVTKTGREVECTSNHPFATYSGWKKLQDLSVGDTVATAWRLPQHGGFIERDHHCRLLGYMAGNGTCGNNRGVGFITPDKDVFEDVRMLVTTLFPPVSVRMKPHSEGYFEADFPRLYENGYGKPGGNEFREWLREIGVNGKIDYQKDVPGYVFASGASGAAEFLSGYLATDGCVKKVRARWSVHFDSTSKAMLVGVQALLTRIGVISSLGIGAYNTKSTRPIYRLMVSAMAPNLLRFASLVEVKGKKGRKLREIEIEYEGYTPVETGPGFEGLPKELSPHMAAMSGRKDQGKQVRRSAALECAVKTGDSTLGVFARSDLLWEKIKSIDPVGEKEVFDIKIKHAANFLGNGIVLHNSGSLEMDADVVIFLYRAPDAADNGQGIVTDILLKKQRNGPTGRVRLLFNRSCTRFEPYVEKTQAEYEQDWGKKRKRTKDDD